MMTIGCLKEIKDHQFRVGLTPISVADYVKQGAEVYIESGAGSCINFEDIDYIKAGAKVVSKEEVYENAKMIIKVKEPLESEYKYFKQNQILYTYLHLAANKNLTQMLLDKKILSIAYETIQEGRFLPALAPMSSIAGRMSVLEGAKYLQKTYGGNGTLISGVAGTPKGNVLILGAGVVGLNAAQMAFGMGANVRILDIDTARLAYIDQIFNSQVTTLFSNEGNVLNSLKNADIVIGSVLIPGAKAPKLIRKEHLSLMKKGAVIVDVAIDQGGCIETSFPTTHTDPTFIVDGIVHYSVANMPGAVAKTSTIALTNTTTLYGLKIARDLKDALLSDEALLKGLNTINGICVHEGVGSAFGLQVGDARKEVQKL